MTAEEPTVQPLETVWRDSTDDPLSVYKQDDPPAQTGTFVIRPEERVPATGTTTHDGLEISVVLEGELTLVTERSYHVTAPSLVVIPAGVAHYSRNDGDEPVRLTYAIFGEL